MQKISPGLKIPFGEKKNTCNSVAMPPVEGPVAVVQPGVMEQQQQQQQGGGQVSLSVLIEMIVQRTYHELSILAELLPRQLDLDALSFSGVNKILSTGRLIWRGR